MKTNATLRKHQHFLPMGFGWHIGSKSSVKKIIKLPTKNRDEVHYG